MTLMAVSLLESTQNHHEQPNKIHSDVLRSYPCFNISGNPVNLIIYVALNLDEMAAYIFLSIRFAFSNAVTITFNVTQ